jgi:hypothetical protein
MCDMKNYDIKPESFNETFTGFWLILKENKILGLSFGLFIALSAPAFGYFFDYYLKNVVNFSEVDFIIKNLSADLVYLIALVILSLLITKLYLSQIQFGVLFLYLIFISLLVYIIRVDIINLI